jgi:nucleoside-diphosphate-sugar epimerase
MLIAILGSTGGIGGHVLSWALDAGHPVRALARRPEALPRRDSLTVVRGDALDAAAVAETIAGAGAVVSALGPRGAKSESLLAGAAANIVAAMDKTGARRLVCVSAAGAYIASDPNTGRLVKAILPRVFAKQFADTRHAGPGDPAGQPARYRPLPGQPRLPAVARPYDRPCGRRALHRRRADRQHLAARSPCCRLLSAVGCPWPVRESVS